MTYLIRVGEQLQAPDGSYVLRTHVRDAECDEFGCAIHNPSDNFMNRQGWAYNWRGGFRGLERMDPIYGIGHIDIDSRAFALRHGFQDPARGHGCAMHNGYPICDPRAWE